jgi:hypothetical protein
MRKVTFVLFSALVLAGLSGTLNAQEKELCDEEETLSAIGTFERLQFWNETFASLIDAKGLTKQQISVLQAALELGTPEYFQAKPGTAEWSIRVEATSNALLESAFRALPPDIYGAVWLRFQMAPGASRFAAAVPVCNCSTDGGACTAGGVQGTCSQTTTCATCGGAKTGVCSV